MLEFDPNSDVRRAVLISIAISTKTLPTVLARTRDTKDVIRQATYQLLAEKVHMRALSIAQRVMILERGLKDRAGSFILHLIESCVACHYPSKHFFEV